MAALPAGLVAIDRTVIEELVAAKLGEVQALVDLLDRFDGDPDREDDDPAGQCDEDGVNTCLASLHLHGDRGPGCPISDPDCEYR